MTNVALLVLDTVRKDYFDEYAPRLQELADVVFDRCYAPSSWSVPSHASIFSGRLPSDHGVHSYNPNYGDLEGTFFEGLDHRSVGLSANGAVSESFGAEALFDTFDSFAGNDEYSFEALSFSKVADETGIDRYRRYISMARERGVLLESLRNGLYIKINERLTGSRVPKLGDFGAKEVTDRALREAAGEPFFLFANFIDAHGPMENLRHLDADVPYEWHSRSLSAETVRETDREGIGEYLQNYRDLYASSVRYLDDQVASFVERLQAQTVEDTVVIVTADHGEELRLPGERDLGHMDFSTALLHVPFVVIGADGPDDTGLTSLLDVGDIVRGIVEDGSVPDVSRERVPAERPGMLFFEGEDRYWTRGVRTVYEGDVRYEWDTQGRRLRYEVETSHDGAVEKVEIPERIRGEFAVSLDSVARPAASLNPDVDGETMRQLEDLGYKV